MSVPSILNVGSITQLSKVVTVPMSYLRAHYASTAFFAVTAGCAYTGWNVKKGKESAPTELSNINSTPNTLTSVS